MGWPFPPCFATLRRACDILAGTHLFRALWEYGDDALKRPLETDLAKHFTLVNTIATKAQSSVNPEHCLKQKILAALKTVTKRNADASPPGLADAPAKAHQIKPRSMIHLLIPHK